MRRVAGTGLAVLVLVGVPLGALAIGRSGGAATSAGLERHHYFLVGRRICAHALASLPPGGQGVQFGFRVSGTYPARFRKAVSAGCRAAIREWPVLGYDSPPAT